MDVPNTGLPWYIAVLLSLICISGCYGNSCFPVAEGDSCTLTCKGNVTSSDMTIIWDVLKDQSGPVARCQETGCDSSTATFSVINGSFDSNLTIEVTSELKNKNVSCTLYLKDKDERNVLETWTLSEIYHSPKSPTCMAQKVTPNTINVTCETEKVYPDIRCSYIDSSGRVEFQSNHYKPRDKKDGFASCSANITVTSPGSYTFSVSVLPDVWPVCEQDNYIQTNTVTIDNRPEVIIKDRPFESAVCPNDNLTLTCEIWLKSKPINLHSFKWQNLSSVEKEVKRACYDKAESNITRCITVLNIMPTMNSQIQIVCEAFDQGNNPVSDSVQLRVHSSPSQPPKFVLNNGNSVKAVEVFRKQNVRLHCQVPEGMSSVRVECLTSDQSVVFLNLTSPTPPLNFSLTESPDLCHATCTCSATHPTGCYNQKESVTFSTSSHCAALSMTVPSSHLNSTYVIYYLILCTIGVILVTLICGSAAFLCRHYDKHYEYYENCFTFRISQTCSRYCEVCTLTVLSPFIKLFNRLSREQPETRRSMDGLNRHQSDLEESSFNLLSETSTTAGNLAPQRRLHPPTRPRPNPDAENQHLGSMDCGRPHGSQRSSCKISYGRPGGRKMSRKLSAKPGRFRSSHHFKHKQVNLRAWALRNEGPAGLPMSSGTGRTFCQEIVQESVNGDTRLRVLESDIIHSISSPFPCLSMLRTLENETSERSGAFAAISDYQNGGRNVICSKMFRPPPPIPGIPDEMSDKRGCHVPEQ